MRLRRLVLGALETNCFIVSDDANGRAVVIDPADQARSILKALEGRQVAAIVLTHGHFDHLGGVAELMAATGAPLLVHDLDAHAVTSADRNGGAQFGFDAVAPKVDRRLADGDHIEAGELVLEVLHTPGHTPGGISLLGDGHLFSGDTLFSGSVGRTDFPGGDARTLRASVARLGALPPETTVHPGHGPDTTIARERKINPFIPRA
ncbi:MAG: MBL fold metallo-hydrolase [Coriobacteriia bacterium]|nr:MBL fold metallo-hydrolase [Coriobacteriia bacterium]MBN2823545.1 MBL fold metallo-hydrolase [Coriobacteriia bacterium]